MQREWKTWSQIADMIIAQLKQGPYGHGLHWIEFSDIDDERSLASFTLNTDDMSDREAEIVAGRVLDMLTELREKYKISSKTLH